MHQQQCSVKMPWELWTRNFNHLLQNGLFSKEIGTDSRNSTNDITLQMAVSGFLYVPLVLADFLSLRI